MSFKSTLLAATAFLASANAHILMKSPVPYNADTIDNSPINAAGYPCKFTSSGFKVSTMNKMAVGEQQKISFEGSAVHNGGSCQLSVTKDTSPTKDSVFKVIKSIEGGCPGLEATTKEFNFEIPDSVPNGKLTFAWTWFPVSAGGPEMYMNCAPIDVSGGASDDTAFNSLPDMLVANLDSTTCKRVENTILKFPNPGEVLESADDSREKVAPTGECGASGNSPAPSGAASASSAAPVVSSAVPSNPGGVFAPSASSGGAAQSTMTTLVTITAAPSAGLPSAAPSAGLPSAAPSAPGTGTPAQPSSPATPSTPSTPPTSGGSACTENGAIVCNGETQFGLCNNGQVVWQAVAAGTTCSNGVVQKRGYNGRIARPRAVVPGKDFVPGQ